jgi:uncharacterized OsmC-like protein
MTSTLHGALEARGISSMGRVITDIEGDYAYEERDKSNPTVLSNFPRRLLSALRLRFRVTLPPGRRAEVEHALDHLEERCAVHRTFKRGIDLSYTWDIQEEK